MRAHVFIDGANVFHSTKDYNRAQGTQFRMDFEQLANFLADKTDVQLIRTHYYTGIPHNVSDKQMGFLTKLETLTNFEVKTKTLQNRNGKPVEKGVDALIVTDMLWNGLQGHCEHIILVSGDEDLAPAVERLKDNGIRVTVAAFYHNASNILIRSADRYIDLAEHTEFFSLDNNA